MKKGILLFTLVAGFGSFVISSYRTGPATHGWDCTGAETAGTSPYTNVTGCNSGGGCHATSATTTVSVNIQLDSAGVALTHYVAGNAYTVNITGVNGTGTVFPYCGFQLTSMKGSVSMARDTGAGTWSTTLPARTHITPPGTYTQFDIVEHNDTIPVLNDTFSLSFTWTAPVAGTGTISFWGAVNFVNGTDVSGSLLQEDLWNTNHIVITELGGPVAAVNNIKNNIQLMAFPNPVINNLTLQLENAHTGIYAIQVFDLNGKIVYSENVLVNSRLFTSNVNTYNWLPGTYNILLEKDSDRHILTVIKL